MENLTFKLGPCQEPEELYLRHKAANERIATSFAKYKHNIIYPPNENIPSPDLERIYNCSGTKEIPYGTTTTLGKSGCAVFALHQALRLKHGINIEIRELARLVDGQGYYYPGRGTYHNLFDHTIISFNGSKADETDESSPRAESVNVLLNYLANSSKPIATLLVQNYVFYGRNTGKHFVNAIGLSNLGIIIDDPESAERKTISFDTVIQATEVAWLW